MKKRLYFDKIEDMKYISHLDMMRFLESAFKKGQDRGQIFRRVSPET